MLGRRRWLGLLAPALLAVLALVLLWPSGPTGPTTAQPVGPDPESGLVWVAEDELPQEARDTLALVDAGGPFPYAQDGGTFFNREQLLPERPEGYYREFTVETPGSQDRGPRRIVTGDQGDAYWTVDHYASFERIAR